MHAPLNPSRVLIVFIYLGALVEALTGAGAGRIASHAPGSSGYQLGGVLISISLVLQASVECLFISAVARIHYCCVQKKQLPANVRTVCMILYGTSSLVLVRCIYRAVESFAIFDGNCSSSVCAVIEGHEWYLYVFDGAPMVLYTYWLNLYHPGRFLPVESKRYLDLGGKTERMGPGWIDHRSTWKTFLDPFDFKSVIHGRSERAEFWLRPEEWPVCEDGSFAQASATNVKRRHSYTSAQG